MTLPLRHFALALLLVGPAIRAPAQPDEPGLPLFADSTPLQLTIEGPFRTLSRERSERDELPARVTATSPDGATTTLEIELRTRGNSRMRVCTYPPLRLDFRRRDTAGSVFAGQNRLKLVTLCKSGEAYREYLALEFAVYRALNELTPYSYRVRWAEIEYVDTDTRRAPTRRPGFLIEDVAELAARTGTEVWETDSIGLSGLDPRSTALVSIFQFLIGNTDWAGTAGAPGERCCHNADVVRAPSGLAVLIPYDFDQSGLIDTDYAQPAADLGIRSVRQRVYRGYCVFNDALDATIDHVIETREQIETAFTSIELRERTARRVERYLDDFYDVVRDPDTREAMIDSTCRR